MKTQPNPQPSPNLNQARALLEALPLGQEDAAALRLVLDALDKRTRALDNLVAPAAQAEDDLGSLLDGGVIEGEEALEASINANLDDLVMQIGKADAALQFGR